MIQIISEQKRVELSSTLCLVGDDELGASSSLYKVADLQFVGVSSVYMPSFAIGARDEMRRWWADFVGRGVVD